MPKYKIADVVFYAETRYGYNEEICKDYLYEGEEEPAFFVSITNEDILYEKAECEKQEDLPLFTDAYLESVSLFRKFSEYLFKKANGIVFHCSAIAMDEKGYLFTGRSGAGKSTHARLWRECFGNRVVTINDDKPVIRKIDGKYYVYGTPWTGKHKLGANVKAEVKGVVEIIKDKNNKLEKMSTVEALSNVLNQTLRPNTEDGINDLIDYAEDFIKKTGFYKLKCNISLDAVKTVYEGIE